MGVYIKGMEMPKNCDDCLLNADCPHDQSMDGYKMQGGRPRTCPLVHVPPHGDLIDRDPFIEFIKTHWNSYGQWFVKQLKARPTIIPAEEE